MPNETVFTYSKVRKAAKLSDRKLLHKVATSAEPETVLTLIRLFQDANSHIRDEVLMALIEAKSPLVPIVAQAGLSDGFSVIRCESARVLGAVGAKEDVRRLIQAMCYDTDFVVRADAALALGELGGKRAKKALIKALKTDPDPVVRRDIADGLRILGDVNVLPVLKAALETEVDDRAKVGLLCALYGLGEEQHLEGLLALLASPDLMVRDNVVNSIYPYLIRSEDRPVVVAALTAFIGSETIAGVKGNAKAALKRLKRE